MTKRIGVCSSLRAFEEAAKVQSFDHLTGDSKGEQGRPVRVMVSMDNGAAALSDAWVSRAAASSSNLLRMHCAR